MKTYHQYCPVARALDLVGERWALLIARDLLRGPKRYSDLAEGLPGIGTNILAARLRDLEAAGVVRKTKLPPPTPVTLYELTEYGRELDDVIGVLGRWGARSLTPPDEEDVLPPGWSVEAARRGIVPERTRGVRAIYELRLGEREVTTISIDDGSVDVTAGAGEGADVVVELEPRTMCELIHRALTAREAFASGRARLVRGRRREFERLLAAIDVAAPAAA